LRWKLVSPRVFIRELQLNFELDRDQVLAAHLTRSSGRNHRFDGGQTFFTADRSAHGGENAGGITRLHERLLAGELDQAEGDRRGDQGWDETTHAASPDTAVSCRQSVRRLDP
jgi:hypothetical protein